MSSELSKTVTPNNAAKFDFPYDLFFWVPVPDLGAAGLFTVIITGVEFILIVYVATLLDE